MKKVHALKVNLKQLATEIRTLKAALKKAQRAHESSYGFLLDWGTRKREFRHKHIAYCQLRGRTRDQIERPGEGNLPDEALIQEIMSKYFDEPIETSL